MSGDWRNFRSRENLAAEGTVDGRLHERNRLAGEVADAALTLRKIRRAELAEGPDFNRWCQLRDEQRQQEAEAHHELENALDEYERFVMREEEGG